MLYMIKPVSSVHWGHPQAAQGKIVLVIFYKGCPYHYHVPIKRAAKTDIQHTVAGVSALNAG